jgi:hypothetical protein
MNYLFLGDTHGDLDFAIRAAEVACANDAEIIQVGDWGFIWHNSNQVAQLSLELMRVGEREAKPPVVMRFIDGNHDHHPELRQRDNTLAPNVIYQPRGSTHTDAAGTRFLFMGGAPSIDKGHRTEGVSWWSEEEITDEEFKRGMEAPKADVVISHDAPDYPPGFQPLGDSEFRIKSYQSMEYVRRLLWKHDPILHVHGHWHSAYVNGVTRGLDCNYGKFTRSYFLWRCPHRLSD